MWWQRGPSLPERTERVRDSPRMLPTGVTVVIPAFNEELAIGRQLHEIAAVMRHSGWDFEVIVVDDGSTDATADVAGGCGARLIRLADNGGYGQALKAGIAAADHDWILITDADGTYPAQAIPSLLAHASGTGMVVGARIGSNVHIPMVRRAPKRLLGLYASLVTMRRIPDLNSGLRLMHISLVKRFWDLLPSGFSFTSTITLAMLTTGQDVSYVKIDYLPRVGNSKVRPADFFRIFRLITRMAIRFRPLHVLIPMGLFASLLASAPGLLWGHSGRSLWPAMSLGCVTISWTAGLILERKAKLARGATP
jgi:glycosyltransferase involved in cell wall biosynthesis